MILDKFLDLFDFFDNVHDRLIMRTDDQALTKTVIAMILLVFGDCCTR